MSFAMSRVRGGLGILAALLLALGLAGQSTAGGLTSCGSFQWDGMAVKVKATGLDCDRARHVMAKLWNGSRPKGWDCDGPQTGYGTCERGDKRIVGRLQY